MNLSEQIKEYALSLGFHLVRIIPAEPVLKDGAYYKKWLEEGLEADLEYMKKDPKKRFEPANNLPEVKSIICLGMNYYQPLEENFDKKFGRVARYAWGKDYHLVIEKKLKTIRKFIIEKTNISKKDFKLYVDAGPILERAYAAKAGLGFIGKNSTLITKEFGSWIFLSEILTTIGLDYDKQKALRALSCGTCQKCIDSCPTKAIIKPYSIDAIKCISYQTIENKGKIPDEIRKKMDNRIFGCDICQEVCPHNSRAKKTDIKEFLQHRASAYLDPKELNKITQEEFNKKYSGSPVKRAGLKGLIRNTEHML